MTSSDSRVWMITLAAESRTGPAQPRKDSRRQLSGDPGERWCSGRTSLHSSPRDFLKDRTAGVRRREVEGASKGSGLKTRTELPRWRP